VYDSVRVDFNFTAQADDVTLDPSLRSHHDIAPHSHNGTRHGPINAEVTAPRHRLAPVCVDGHQHVATHTGVWRHLRRSLDAFKASLQLGYPRF
jgi:hypothetical protein